MLEVICGPMFSGKSTELLRRLKRAEIAGLNPVLIRPDIDHTKLTHDGLTMPYVFAKNGEELRFDESDYQVIGIDEVQFFDEESIPAILRLASLKDVIVSGLDTTYRFEPFGIMPTLMALAERVDKLSAICVKCGKEGTRTQRMVNSKPAKYDDPTILVGEEDFYEARCSNCWEIG